jgi:hypothetical protein
MGLGGSLLVADRQPFAVENIGTHSLGIAADAVAETHKVDLAADALRPHFEIYEHRGDMADLPTRVDANELAWPHLVLSAVDSIEARHDVRVSGPITTSTSAPAAPQSACTTPAPGPPACNTSSRSTPAARHRSSDSPTSWALTHAHSAVSTVRVRDPSPGCYCQQRRAIIARVRDYRSAFTIKPV